MEIVFSARRFGGSKVKEEEDRGRTFTGFLQVRENWKRSGNLGGQGKSGKVRENA